MCMCMYIIIYRNYSKPILDNETTRNIINEYTQIYMNFKPNLSPRVAINCTNVHFETNQNFNAAINLKIFSFSIFEKKNHFVYTEGNEITTIQKYRNYFSSYYLVGIHLFKNCYSFAQM